MCPRASRTVVIEALKRWARALRAQIAIAWYVARHPGTPRGLKLWWGFTLAYALSPIDLIPDFIPVLGLVDDLIVLPIMVWLGLRWTAQSAPKVLAEAKRAALVPSARLPRSRVGAACIIACWLIAAVALTYFWLVK